MDPKGSCNGQVVTSTMDPNGTYHSPEVQSKWNLEVVNMDPKSS